MPGLREFLDFVRDCAEQSGKTFTEDFTVELERQIKARFATERIYIPPPSSREQAGRAERIAAMARKLPAAVVAERMGVTAGYVRKLVRQSNARRA